MCINFLKKNLIENLKDGMKSVVFEIIALLIVHRFAYTDTFCCHFAESELWCVSQTDEFPSGY